MTFTSTLNTFNDFLPPPPFTKSTPPLMSNPGSANEHLVVNNQFIVKIIIFNHFSTLNLYFYNNALKCACFTNGVIHMFKILKNDKKSDKAK